MKSPPCLEQKQLARVEEKWYILMRGIVERIKSCLDQWRRRLLGQMYTITPISPNHLYWPLQTGPNDIIEVTLDNQANVYLLDLENYNKYRQGQPFEYHKGLWATVSPVRIRPPYQGLWTVVVDLGGSPGQIRASTAVIGPLVNSDRENVCRTCKR